MRRLTFFVFFLAAVYSGYWFVGSRAVEAGARNAISRAQADGWQFSLTSLDTIGFPSRFDTTVMDIAVAPPDRRWAWQAPFVQVFALSYQPNRIIAAFANDQSVRIADQTITIASDGLRASVGVKADTDLTFDALTAEVGDVSLRSDFGWEISLDRALAAMRAHPQTQARYDLYLDAANVVLPAGVVRDIDQAAQLGDTISGIVFDAALLFDRPLDRHAFDGSGPAPLATNFTLNEFNMRWGRITIRADGDVAIDERGNLDGRIVFRSDQWREMIDIMVAAGIIDAGVAPTVTNVATAMALGGGTLELPLVFRNGTLFIGPLPVGSAPRLRQ